MKLFSKGSGVKLRFKKGSKAIILGKLRPGSLVARSTVKHQPLPVCMQQARQMEKKVLTSS